MKRKRKYLESVALRKVFLVLVSLMCVNYSNAFSDISVRIFDKNEMLASNYSAFSIDKEGFLWIGTDAGLLRFDGNICDIYRNDERLQGSISDSKIVSLYCDTYGNVWVGTANGLNYYDRDTDSFTLIELSGVKLNGFIGQIIEDDSGRLLVLVGGVGLFTVSMDKNGNIGPDTRLQRIALKDDNQISHLVKMSNGDIFVTFLHGQYGILHKDGSYENLGKLDTDILRANVEKDGNVLLSSQYDVFRLNMQNRSVSKLGVKGGERIKITGIETADDCTIFSSSRLGLWEVKAGSPSIMRSERMSASVFDFSNLSVGNTYLDEKGNLWVGCNSKGIVMLPARKSPFISMPLSKIVEKGKDKNITCIAATDDRIILGIDTGHLLILDYEGNLLETIDTPNHSLATSISTEGNDRAIVGLAHDGIWQLDIRRHILSPITSIEDHYAGIILSMAKNGDILAALSETGILKYNLDSKERTMYHAKEGSDYIATSYYSGISRTSDGKMWIGGFSGLSCYDPSVGKFMPIDQSPFLDGVVHAVCDADDGCIYIGTGRGLLKYHPKKGVIKKYTFHDGLADNDVRAIARDYNGGLWIGTLKGLSYLKDEDSRIQSYRSEIGLSETSVVSNVQILNRNKILLAGHEGISFFNPDSVASAAFGAKIMVSGIFLNGEKVTPASGQGASKCIIEGNQYSPDVIHLSYKDKSLVLRLSTMDFRDASGVRYEWQLDGEGDNWNSTSLGEYFLYLPSLEPGTYVLRLRGWDNEVCSDISEIKLDIAPPVYLSSMAYSFYVIMGLILMALIYKVFRSKREVELNEAKIKYFMDISHEIRTPITLLLNPIDTLLKQKQSPDTTAQLMTARRNANRVLSLADQLLDLRKIEKGKMRLVFTPTDIRVFIEELVEMFRPQAEEKGISISFICQNDSLWGEIDCDNLDKILANLFSNAIKYTPSGGTVKVALELQHQASGQDMYVVTVTDTGIGLDNKLISHMFERFYRGRENHVSGTSGFGIGLDLCMRLVSLHSGKITGENRSDGTKGSVFTVSLPLIPVKSRLTQDDSGKGKNQHLPCVPVVVADEMDKSKTKGVYPRIKVMIVDDDAELLDYIRDNLGNGYKVVTMSDGESAQKAIAAKQPDIIVTDIKMEGIDGFELLKRVKTNLSTHHIPVIVLSSSSEVEDRTRGWKLGADGFLAKPFSIEELVVMINGLLDTRNKLKGVYSRKNEEVKSISAPKLEGKDEKLLRKINKYIDENLSEPTLNVDAMSDYIGLSRSQFHRRIKDMLGISPSDYIRNVRLQKATEMLRDSDIEISQIAFSLGFNSQSHFSTFFKRFTGVSPSEYRMRNQTSNDSTNS